VATSPEPAYRDLIDPRGRGFEANRRIGHSILCVLLFLYIMKHETRECFFSGAAREFALHWG